MFIRHVLIAGAILAACLAVSPSFADQRSDPREQAMSDTLDIWREGRFEPLYNSLSQRGGTSREQFVRLLKETSSRPACCFTKLQDFRVINDKRTTSKVFARIAMEGAPGNEASHSREFTLDHEEGRWKMRLNDIKKLSGASGKKNKRK